MPRPYRIIVALLIVFGVFGSAHYYVFARLVRAPSWPDPWPMVLGFAVLGMFLLTPGALLLGRLFLRRAPRPLLTAGYLWLGTMLLLLTGLGLSEILRVSLEPSVPDPELSRWLAGAVAGGVFLVATYGVVSVRLGPRIKRQPIRLSRLPRSAAGFRLVQLSDVHIGPLLKRPWLERVVAKVNALEPDAVVITGDLVDGSVAELANDVAPLRDLQARCGVYFVTGNHEYYAGADPWIAELERLGIRVLRNERVSLGDEDASFDLAGVDDWQAFGPGHGADLNKALQDRDVDRELVLLAHQPRQIREAQAHGVGLQLSGHTHGGQIVPWNFFVRFQQPKIAGLSLHGGTQLYVSCGTGFWGPPMRVGAPGEITLLELHPA